MKTKPMMKLPKLSKFRAEALRYAAVLLKAERARLRAVHAQRLLASPSRTMGDVLSLATDVLSTLSTDNGVATAIALLERWAEDEETKTPKTPKRRP